MPVPGPLEKYWPEMRTRRSWRPPGVTTPATLCRTAGKSESLTPGAALAEAASATGVSMAGENPLT